MKAEAGREWSCGHSAAWVRGLSFPQAKRESLRRIQGKFLIGLLGFPQAKWEISRRIQGKFWLGFLAFLKPKEKSYKGFKVSCWSGFLAFLKWKEKSYEGFKVSFWYRLDCQGRSLCSKGLFFLPCWQCFRFGLIDSGSGSRVLITKTKNWEKFTAEKNVIFFGSQIAIYLSLGLHKGRPIFSRSLQPSKRTFST